MLQNSYLNVMAVGMTKAEIFTCPGVGYGKLDGKLEKVRKIQIYTGCFLT